MNTNFVQLQQDCYYALLANAPLNFINVVLYRKLRQESQIDLDVIWQNPRAGKSGAGILVEMPKVDVTSSNVSGPPLDLIMTFVVIEEPNINLTPDVGTLLSAEEISQLILAALHLQCFGPGGTLTASGIQEAKEFPPGLIAYRVSFRLKLASTQPQRCSSPQIAINAGGLATLTTSTPGAQLYYTLDGDFPGGSNPAAQLYANPVAVSSGDIIRFAAYAPGFNPSEIRISTIP